MHKWGSGVATVAGLALAGIGAASASGTVSLSELVHSSAVRELQLVPASRSNARVHTFEGTSRGAHVVFKLRGVKNCQVSTGSAHADGRTIGLSATKLNAAVRKGVLRMAVRHAQHVSLSFTCKPSSLTSVSTVKRTRRGGPPANTALPTLQGTAIRGDALTTTHGTWTHRPTSYAYQWQDCNSSGTNCTDISGATSQGYTLQASDVGAKVRALVAASNSYGSNSASSAVVGPVAPLVTNSPAGSAPANTAAPSVSGTDTQSNMLSTSNGSWSGSPTGFGYQWQDCNSSGAACTDIAGATSQTYMLQASDVGNTVRAVIAASNPSGAGIADSAATATIQPTGSAPANTALPTVTGTATQGSALTTSNGSWSGNPTSFGYQWQDCNSSGTNCADISGATSQGYTLQSSDVGNTLRAVVTASNALGNASANSAATSVVQPTGSAPANTALPTVTGTAKQGSALTTSNGSWSGNPTSFGYQWQDCNSSGTNCADISGATSQGYTLQSSDVGNTLRAVVTASNALGNASANSAASSVAQPAGSPPANTAVPTVSGTTTQGSALTTSNGSWSGNPTSFGYQWQDCNSSGTGCTNISGATSQTYTLQSSDVGNTLRAVVSASNALGNASANSAVTAVVQSSGSSSNPPASTAAPSVSGSATQGSTLTAGNGSWSGSPTSFRYQWEDCNGAGATCVPVSGATSSSYTPAASDVMDKIVVQVTASNSAGSSSPATSTATGPVSGSYTCTKYASPSGSNSGTGSVSSPYADIAYLENQLSAGQTGCLESGTYGNTGSATEYDLNASGTSGSPITIAPAPGATPRVIGWLVLFGNYVTLEYLNIDGSNTAYAANAGINALSHPVSAATEINGTGDVFQYNDFYQSVSSQRGVGILVGDYYNGYFPSSVIIRYNDLHDVGNPGDPSSGNAYDHIIYADSGTGTQIYDNWMWGDPAGYCVQLFPNTSNDVIKNNVCDNSGSGIIIDNDGGSTASNGNTMSNNVITNLTGLSANGTEGQGVLGWQPGTNDSFINNDCFNCPSGVHGEGSGGNAVSGITLSGNVSTNPEYANAGAHDYQLQSGSPVSSYGLWNGLGAAPAQSGF